ncbi:MAG: SAM-dependent methyltransferase [Archaeoglobales archaeon]|nr:MAG: SAM-dependent methyltransferase [Archaeoglobales archaeon]
MRAAEVQLSNADFAKVERAVSRAVELIRRGIPKEKILKRVKNRGLILSPSDIYEMAKFRIKARKKFTIGNKLFFDELGLRYSTPETIAEYRAKRLKCDVMADVSCGVGGQLIFFAKYCRKVYGVELNPRRAVIAALNAMVMELKNVEIISGDALSDDAVAMVRDAEVVFSDPSRPPEEDVRTLDSLEPNPLKVVEKYRKITDKIAFELPPQMPPERVDMYLKGEKEYTSLNFKLNRLALYMNELAECKVSAVSLPSEERVTNEDEKVKIKTTEKIKTFLYEVDTTVVKAGLLENLIGKIGLEAELLKEDKRRTLITSNEDANSAFLRKYEVLDVVSFEKQAIKKALKEAGAGKVTLRFSLPPSEYWHIRKKFENELTGDRWVHLFRVGNTAIVVERRKFDSPN